MAIIIAAVGQKGGGGKSTTVISLAVEFARQGKKVLIGDADPQGTCRTWYDVAVERYRDMDPEARVLVPVIGLHKGMHLPGQLPTDGYDVVLIDTPAKLQELTKCALALCHFAISPVGAGGIETWALAATQSLVEDTKILRPDLQVYLLVNKKQQSNLFKATRATLETQQPYPVLKTEFGLRTDFQESITAGQGPTTYKGGDSKAAQEVRALIYEVTNAYYEATTRGKAHGGQALNA